MKHEHAKEHALEQLATAHGTQMRGTHNAIVAGLVARVELETIQRCIPETLMKLDVAEEALQLIAARCRIEMPDHDIVSNRQAETLAKDVWNLSQQQGGPGAEEAARIVALGLFVKAGMESKNEAMRELAGTVQKLWKVTVSICTREDMDPSAGPPEPVE